MCPWCSWICSRCLEKKVNPTCSSKINRTWFTIVKSTPPPPPPPPPPPEPNKSSGKVFKHISPILHKSPLWLYNSLTQFSSWEMLLLGSLKSGIQRGKLMAQTCHKNVLWDGPVSTHRSTRTAVVRNETTFRTARTTKKTPTRNT